MWSKRKLSENLNKWLAAGSILVHYGLKADDGDDGGAEDNDDNADIVDDIDDDDDNLARWEASSCWLFLMRAE